MLKNVPTIQIQKVATFKSDRRKSIYSQTFIFQMLQLVGLVAIKTHIFCRELSFFVNTPFKGSERVILSDPPCEDDNARFTTVPVKRPVPSLAIFYCRKNIFSDAYTFQTIQIHYPLDKSFLGIFVNRALSSLHGGSLKIKLTVPLRTFCF